MAHILQITINEFKNIIIILWVAEVISFNNAIIHFNLNFVASNVNNLLVFGCIHTLFIMIS